MNNFSGIDFVTLSIPFFYAIIFIMNINLETLNTFCLIAWLLFMFGFCTYKYTSQNKKYSQK